MKGTVHLDHADILDAIARYVGSIAGSTVSTAYVKLEIGQDARGLPTLSATVTAERRR